MQVNILRLLTSTLRQKWSTVTGGSRADWQEEELASLRRDAATYRGRIAFKRDAKRRFLIVGPGLQHWVSTPEEVTEEIEKQLERQGPYAVNQFVTVVDTVVSPIRQLTPSEWCVYRRRGKAFFA